MDLHRVLTTLREELADSTAVDRAEAIQELARTIYDHVKFYAPEGGGLEGADGPERDALGIIVDEATSYRDDLRLRGMGAPPAPDPLVVYEREVDVSVREVAAEEFPESGNPLKEAMLRGREADDDRPVRLTNRQALRICQVIGQVLESEGSTPSENWPQLGASWSLLAAALAPPGTTEPSLERAWARLDALPLVAPVAGEKRSTDGEAEQEGA